MESISPITELRGLSQLVAVSIQNLVILIIGMNMGYLTILIPSLTDGTEPIYLTESQISWISSIALISSLLGSVLSGAITERFGRKRTMMVLTIPFFIPWIGYYFVTELWHIYACLVVHGITNGLAEAPVLAYVAEITEPCFRGMLSATSTLTAIFGVFIEIFIGSCVSWRTTSLVSSVLPIFTFFLLSILPETPYWLLSQKKPDKARKSLSWLRNWTKTENIELEFREIQNNCDQKEFSGNQKVTKDDTNSVLLFENSKKILTIPTCCMTNKYTKKSFLYPFLLIMYIFTLSNFAGNFTLQTFGIVIFSTFNVPMNKYYATVLMGAAECFGSLLCIFFVRYFGKRIIGFVSISGVAMCNVLLGIYSYYYDIMYLGFNSVPLKNYVDTNGWIPLCLLLFMAFISHLGTKNLPWMLIGEIFSNDTRSVGCGLATSTYYISAFAATKLYLSMISVLSLPGTFAAYFCICISGLFIVYFLLPETEGKTLEEIANYFKGRSTLNTKMQA